MKIHMLGIKGTGMSALAIVLKQMGHEVSGSDIEKNLFTEEELLANNIEVKKFDKNNLVDVDTLIVGHNFVDCNNVELMEAKKRKIKIVEYHKYLSSLIKNHYSIAVTGSNGKTTTTALIATILDEVENTSYLIGSGEGKGNKESKYFTFEACEHQEHFLEYHPNLILINNIDYDHVDYYKNEKDYIDSFYKFTKNAKDKIIINADDKNLKDLKSSICFGINNKSMFNARNIKYDKGIKYDLFYKNDYLGHLDLNLYGEHMVYNTLAALTCCVSLGIEVEVAIKAINKFKGVKRRFKETIIKDDVYIDDYAHHPSKIRAIISAIRGKYKDKKIFVFYRPDRVSRLNYFSSLFAKELLKADKAYILPFLNMGEEEKESIDDFLIKNPKISLANDSVYKRVSKKNGVIYLMVSSKDVSEVKENILKYKGD